MRLGILNVSARAQFPRLEFLAQPFHREADHVCERAANTFDDEIAFLLDGVAARLVEGMDRPEVTADLPSVQLPERDRRAHGEQPVPVRPQMHQANASRDLVRASLEPGQNPLGFGHVGGLAELFGAQPDYGVRSDHEMIGIFLRDDAGLAVGVNLRGFHWAQVLRGDFGRLARQNAEVHARLPEQLGPARRIGGQNDRRKCHGKR
jgi:hypothetical protein